MIPKAVPALVLPLLLSACGVAGAAASVVTAPVKVASKGYDLATTSQSEADEKRGRAARKREEEIGRLAREREGFAEDCFKDRERRACDRYYALTDQMDAVQRQPIER